VRGTRKRLEEEDDLALKSTHHHGALPHRSTYGATAAAVADG